MIPWPKRLTGRIIGATLLLISLLGVFFISVAIIATRQHMQIVDQALNAKLASRIVADNWVAVRDRTLARGHGRTFDKLMGINPNAEIYLLDAAGRILDFSAPPGRVRLERVDMVPLQEFLHGPSTYPLFGDDPREPGRRKVFSAAPVSADDTIIGYVYVVLGGDAYRTVVEMYKNSHVLRLSLLLMIGGLAVTLIVALISLRHLTGRLNTLIKSMIAFERSNFETVPAPLPQVRKTAQDEIDRAYTGFQRMAKRMIRQIATIENQDRVRRELLIHILHDLKTPMATLHGYLETLIMKWQDLDGALRERYLRSAFQFSQQLESIMSELFELAALDDPDIPMQTETFSVSELVQDMGQKFLANAERHGLALKIDSLDETAFVTGDVRLVDRMLQNLIENAIKFSTRPGEVRIRVDKLSGTVVVQVRDSGIGISKHELPHIFDRYYKAEKPAGDGSTGTGLGLAIVKRIVDLHSGTITVDSEVSAGTTFTVSLPCKDSPAGS